MNNTQKTSYATIHHVLIVDDEIEFVKTLKRHLKRQNFTLKTAQDGAEAIQLMARTAQEEEGIDLVVSDVVMPRMDGIQLLEEIKARIIVGAANNQLVDSEMGDKLQKAGMLYAPDYLVNSGGIIDIFYERGDYDFLKVRHHIEEIGETLHEIYKESQERGIATNKVADRIAESRFKGE